MLNKWDDSSNGAYKLQAQLLAAKLTIVNGADVATTISDANNFLATNTKDWDKLSRAQKSSVLSLATTLDKYNNGLIRPAHCSEERTV